MKPKSRLGRGLSSLISVSDSSVAAVQPKLVVEAESAEIEGSAGRAVPQAPAEFPSELPVHLIKPNPHQPRRQFDEESIRQLAVSIKTSGLVQPILVRPVEGGYELVAGERRWRAAKTAGLDRIPAIIRDVDSFTQAQLALIENIHREDLNPLDRATAYRSLLEQLGLTQLELANRLGEDRSTVANFLRLLDLAAPVRELVQAGRLSHGHAKLLAGVADILDQERLAHLAVSQDLSVRNLERLIQSGGSTTASPKLAKAVSAHLQELEKACARQLGLRVQIRPTGAKGRGKLVLHYNSLDQFDDLVARLGVLPTSLQT